MGELRVLIADDSEFMRIAYKRIIEAESSMEVVAMASNGADAVWSTAETDPDVAILDVMMPKVDGIQVAHQIRKRRPSTAIVVISSYEDLSFVADLMRNGVERKAYLLKHSISDITGLVRVVEAVHKGQTVLDSGIIQRMARLFCKHSGDLGTDLSNAEQDLLALMADGYDYERICESLRLDQTQLEERSASMYGKFGIAAGTPSEQRIAAVQAFVEQIHKVPQFRAYDAVG
jgi:DNA-binding NarL/FixJ family response regulator